MKGYLKIKPMLIFSALFVSHSLQACDIPSDEKLVCEVVLCNPVGLAISESRSECLAVNRRFAIYLATLGFWDSPPKCKFRDQSCNSIGRADDAPVDASFCNELDTEDEKNSCLAAIGQAPAEYCESFVDEPEQYEACMERSVDN